MSPKQLLRILQVEDSESDAALILRELQRAGYDVRARRVEDAAEMRQALQAEDWDVVISDHRMAQFDAPAALLILQESGRDIPFVVVSGTISQELAVATMKSGANDYLLKSDLARLAPVVEREIREAQTRHQRRRTEAELRESQERLAMAVEATQLGTFDFFPASGRIVWSEACRRHFGLSEGSELTLEKYRDAIHPDDRDRFDTALSAAKASSTGRYSAEFRAIGIDDRVERWLSVWGHIFFNENGEATRYVGISLDVTARKHLEDQLRQAQKLESVGRLAGGVAHDFNNLLTVITGYSQMGLAELSPDHPLRESLAEISAAAARAGELTRQLLTFSRRQAAHAEPIEINPLLRNFEKMLGRLLGEEIELTIKLDPSAGRFVADPGQIEQVIMNLAVNARDAMPKGGKLVIETSSIYADTDFSQGHLSVKEGPYVVITVTDTGSGMTEKIRAHIFEPFFTTKEPGKGTGLGLSTVWGIVQQSSGSIWVYSEPGRGTTFRLMFPLAASAAEDTTAPQAGPVPSGAETILLAEDEAGVRKYTRQILERYGYVVLAVSNGPEALRTAREFPDKIDLLLTDIVMPQMSGIDLAAKFSELRPQAAVICMSGYSDRIWPEAQTAGHFIQKPFTPAQLLQRIRAILDGREPVHHGL